MKNQKGITLVALVITIIVMIILVGVTIALVNNGNLINGAKTASNDMKTAISNESGADIANYDVEAAVNATQNEAE